MPKKSDAPQPMDPSFREKKVGVVGANNQRVCYAIKTLVSEVRNLFPETPVEYSNYDGRNAALAVTFDCSMLDAAEADEFASLLLLTRTDPRVDEVIVEPDLGASVLVSMKASARTQDSRESFGLARAWEILTEGESPEDFGGWEFNINAGPWPDETVIGGSLRMWGSYDGGSR